MTPIDQDIDAFLRELCNTMKHYHDGYEADGRGESQTNPPHLSEFRQQHMHILRDDAQRAMVLAFVRRAMTAVTFHMLVLMDERKELGPNRVSPKLTLMRDGKELPYCNYLHELLGDVMHDMGMDLNEWWEM